MINCYWEGYLDSEITLNNCPDSADIITISFISPDDNSSIATDYLCCKYDVETIKSWIIEAKLNNPKVKIVISIVDNISTNWSEINLIEFAKRLKTFLDVWKLDGIDIDAESNMEDSKYKETFINLIKTLNSIIEFKKHNKILSYTCHTGNINNDKAILNKTKQYFNYINLIAYYDNIEEYDSLYNTYKKFYNSNNIFICIKAGFKKDKNKNKTPNEMIKHLLNFNKNIKKGILFFSINRDYSKFTGNSAYTWFNIINSCYE